MKKTIVIGATSGIGREIAKLLAEDNHIVGITGRRTELLESLKKEKSNSFFIKTIDIAITKNVVHELNSLVNDLGGLDLLVLSSGTGDLNENLNFDIEKRTIETNILGFTCIADWAFNLFQNQGFGHFVAISSIASIRGSKYAPSYNASKAYQSNYLEGLRQKASSLKSSVYITDIRPGFIDTEMAKGDGLFWVSSTQKAAKQIILGIKRKRKVVYVTKRWILVALILKAMPRFIYDRL
jgi:short-subunit dehydrogenase